MSDTPDSCAISAGDALRTRLAYVSHPIAGDVHANAARAKRWLVWLQNHPRFADKIAFIAPYISLIEMGADDDTDPAVRSRALRQDCAVAVRCDFVFLVGGRLSSGMKSERDVLQSALGGDTDCIVDLLFLGPEPPTGNDVELPPVLWGGDEL